jgi:hypothetical protein
MPLQPSRCLLSRLSSAVTHVSKYRASEPLKKCCVGPLCSSFCAALLVAVLALGCSQEGPGAHEVVAAALAGCNTLVFQKVEGQAFTSWPPLVRGMGSTSARMVVGAWKRDSAVIGYVWLLDHPALSSGGVYNAYGRLRPGPGDSLDLHFLGGMESATVRVALTGSRVAGALYYETDIGPEPYDGRVEVEPDRCPLSVRALTYHTSWTPDEDWLPLGRTAQLPIRPPAQEEDSLFLELWLRNSGIRSGQ